MKKVQIWFAVAFALLAVRTAPAQYISDPLLQALEALRQGKASSGQRALLFQNNGLLNNARLNGWMSDAHYQTLQNDFAKINEFFAKQAAEKAGAEFRVQPRKTTDFQPGTDSDYIVTTTSNDPVGQIKTIQRNYDELVNAWRERCFKAEGMEYKPYSQWYKKLDVDFMANPKNVSAEQFAAIKEINNGAYQRKEAAEYERVSRLAGDQPVGADEIRGYAEEMQGQIAHKQHQIDQIRSDPSLMNDKVARGELQKLMAQEQKYVERLESMAARLRNQERLQQPLPFKQPEIKVTLRDGVYVFEQRQVSVSVKGALRAPGNMGSSVVGSSLTRNSVNRAIRDLADAMAEARTIHPEKWPNAAKDIAAITAELSPSEKGAILECMIRKQTRGGKAMARDVAIEMRKQAAGPSGFEKIDAGLRKIFGVTEGLSEMGQARRAFNEMAMKALGNLDKLNKAFVALQVVQAISDARIYVTSIATAMDPNTTDAEANRAFQQAQSAANSMAMSGGMGVLFTKVPTLGALYMSGSVAYDGTRWFLENTKTGQIIDRNMGDFFDRGIQRSDVTYDSVLAYFGGQSHAMQDAQQQNNLDASYIKALRDGRLHLAPGYTVQQLIAALHHGDKALYEQNAVPADAACPQDRQPGLRGLDQ